MRSLFIVLLLASPTFAQGWKPQLAADYLDSRQEKWFAWPTAQSKDGPCVSCHTGLTYLLARPVLRTAVGENQLTKYEIGLMDRLRSNVGAKPAATLRDVEVIFAALFLARQDEGKTTLSAEAQQAFDQLWSLQSLEGGTKGSWKWYNADLNPWETPESIYYGTALAALAIGSAPNEYRNRPETKDRISSLIEYLQTAANTQPLHNRVALLWASTKLPGVLTESMRKVLIEEILNAQEATGGWTIESLGPWKKRTDAPPTTGISNYATGFVAYVLQQAGIAPSDRRLIPALDLLRSRQDGGSGAWTANSMNKRYPSGSMQEAFMQDAATAFATLALLGGNSITK